MKHVNPNIKAKEYWNFTVNEHGFYDFPAFMGKINELKNQELGVLAQSIIIDAETGQVHRASTNDSPTTNSNNTNVPSLSPRRGSFRRSKSFPNHILQSIVGGEKVVELTDLPDEASKEPTGSQNMSSAEYRAKSKEALLGKKFEITVISHSVRLVRDIIISSDCNTDGRDGHVDVLDQVALGQQTALRLTRHFVVACRTAQDCT